MRARNWHGVVVILVVSGWMGGVTSWAADTAKPSSAPPTPTPAPAASSEATPAATAVTPTPPETILIDDELPPEAKAAGTWTWDATQAASGTKSHGHPVGKGLQQHSVTFASPVAIPKNGELVTSVWLDPAAPPRGIMLKLTLENGEQTGVYWEGEEEVFNPGENEEVWYYGLLPELGTWAPLAVAAEDLGIEENTITGITFVTYDGRVLWDQTIVRQAAEGPAVPPGDEDVDLPTPPATS